MLLAVDWQDATPRATLSTITSPLVGVRFMARLKPPLISEFPDASSTQVMSYCGDRRGERPNLPSHGTDLHRELAHLIRILAPLKIPIMGSTRKNLWVSRAHKTMAFRRAFTVQSVFRLLQSLIQPSCGRISGNSYRTQKLGRYMFAITCFGETTAPPQRDSFVDPSRILGRKSTAPQVPLCLLQPLASSSNAHKMLEEVEWWCGRL